ncbi:MAG: alanine--tRNA ligase [Leptospiraceae bacterium]|nr:alanine--tRNA ligase [Leptospiraceae bacterium]
MPVYSVQDIRKSFLEYFQSKDHKIMPSASLLPASDPTLLFTTAGMVPFKDYFSGIAKPPHPRLASVQKCLRTTDLESVGRTKRHLCFFEMLGNFSFGDYFKKEAIVYAWEYTTSYLPFSKEDIWVSVYHEDNEAYELWTKYIGIPRERVVRLGREDNFWGPAGETGPCGPCSELYLDRGPKFGQESKPGEGGERFLEFWNLVFNQFDFDGKNYLPLKNKGIDTGSGLERLATLVQGVDSVFDTDELRLLCSAIEKHFGVSYEHEAVVPIRVVCDHIRALAFAMADGIYPSAESRGYVLRRILRRALLFARKLTDKEPKLYQLIDEVVRLYGDLYEELKKNSELSRDFLKKEEERFLTTLESGAEKLEEILELARAGRYAHNIIPGKEAFVLYDTYGFPFEMTCELIEQEGFQVDKEGFYAALEEQKSRSRSLWKGFVERLPLEGEKSEFFGYESLSGKSRISLLILHGEVKKILTEEEVGEEDFYLVTEESCFYPEGGGQLGDSGVISSTNGQCRVVDTQKKGDAIVHICRNLTGKLCLGEEVLLSVDAERRRALACHHSATHLLHGALRRVLGAHVRQSGSLVHPDYLRFDFTHPKALTVEEIQKIEQDVNEAIHQKVSVVTEVLTKKEAEKKGALMIFGEKYGEVVRVVGMGNYSLEFCGGTHVKNTSELGYFIIGRESSPGSGNRRIEAYAGEAARKQLRLMEKRLEDALLEAQKQLVEKEYLQKLEDIRLLFKESKERSPSESYHFFEQLLIKIKELVQEQKKKEKKKALALPKGILEQVLMTKQEYGGLSFCRWEGENMSIADLQHLSDKLRGVEGNCIYYLASFTDGGWSLVIATTQRYAEMKKLDFAAAFRRISQSLPVRGGGKRELIQVVQKKAEEAREDLRQFLEAFTHEVACHEQGKLA